MNWSAIFAGWFVIAAVAGSLYFASLALRFDDSDPHYVTDAAKRTGMGSAIWLIPVGAAGLFVADCLPPVSMAAPMT